MFALLGTHFTLTASRGYGGLETYNRVWSLEVAPHGSVLPWPRPDDAIPSSPHFGPPITAGVGHPERPLRSGATAARGEFDAALVRESRRKRLAAQRAARAKDGSAASPWVRAEIHHKPPALPHAAPAKTDEGEEEAGGGEEWREVPAKRGRRTITYRADEAAAESADAPRAALVAAAAPPAVRAKDMGSLRRERKAARKYRNRVNRAARNAAKRSAET